MIKLLVECVRCASMEWSNKAMWANNNTWLVLDAAAGDSTGKYAGVLDCFVKTARNDGLLVSVR